MRITLVLFVISDFLRLVSSYVDIPRIIRIYGRIYHRGIENDKQMPILKNPKHERGFEMVSK